MLELVTVFRNTVQWFTIVTHDILIRRSTLGCIIMRVKQSKKQQQIQIIECI